MPVKIKRAYDPPSRADGVRVLVDRLWPRGVSKERGRIDMWLRDLAPSTELRNWFHGRPSMWRTFRRRYLDELREPTAEAALQQLYDVMAERKQLTLVYASRNTEYNNAVVLKELLEGTRKPPSSSGPEKAALAMRAKARK